MPKDGGIGAERNRREESRFLAGTGPYAADINTRGQAAAVFVRSTEANGRIKSIGTSAAEAMPGVKAVFDALRSGGKSVTHIDMPLARSRVRAAMKNA